MLSYNTEQKKSLFSQYWKTIYMLENFFKNVKMKDFTMRNIVHSSLHIQISKDSSMYIDYTDYSHIGCYSEKVITIVLPNYTLKYSFDYTNGKEWNTFIDG